MNKTEIDVQQRPEKTVGKLVMNPHLWVVAAQIAAVTFVYYFWFFPYSSRFPYLDAVALFEYYNHMNGSLYMIPFLYSTLVFPWQGSVIVWALSMAALLPRLIYMTLSVQATVTNILFTLVPMVVVVSTRLEIRRRKKEQTMLAQKERDRQAYMKQIFKAEDDERRRVAQELHDDTIQTLLVAANYAETLSSCDMTTVRDGSERIKDTLLGVVEDLRRLTLDLSPSILDNLGLVPALRWSAVRLGQETGMEIDVTVEGEPRRLGPENDVNVFRIIQEALNNVRRHSGASKIKLDVRFTRDSLEIIVKDNGKGFNMPERLSEYSSQGRLGLIGMRQRARFLGGTLSIHSNPGEGTKLLLYLKC
ncbi:MAG: sensor histidine kinase [Chloroflexi bacterium]|nr:sensor histidine kinase [Chloroflexota bacterium]